MRKAIMAMVLIFGTCAFFAYTQDTQRKIRQESGKGLYAPNQTYNPRPRPTRPEPTPSVSIASQPLPDVPTKPKPPPEGSPAASPARHTIGYTHVTYRHPTGPWPTPALVVMAKKFSDQLPQIETSR